MTRFGRRSRLIALVAVGALTVACALAQSDYEALRNAMVDSLVERGIVKSPPVEKAMRQVPRHLFVPTGQRKAAYRDVPLPIGHGQTISAPSIVGIMTEALQPQPTDRVLEIGTGSGYQAAVLSRIVRHVYTIEIVEPLAIEAAQRLKDLGYNNVTVRHGDGWLGWPEHQPFDKIIVTAAPDRIPQALIDELNDGGRMVIPVAEKGWGQKLYLVEKTGDELTKTELADVIFVPMTGGPEAEDQADEG